jgi:hypothetical protein
VNTPETLRIASTDLGTLAGDGLIVDLARGHRYTLEVSFDQPYDGPVELLAQTLEAESEVTI